MSQNNDWGENGAVPRDVAFKKGGKGQSKRGQKGAFLSHLYDVVVKQQPEAVTLDYGDVVTAVRTTVRERETKE